MTNKTLIISYLTITIFLFSFCENNEGSERAMIVSKIQSSSKLATVEYVVSKVVSADKKNFLGPDSHFFAETEAHIKAGIDLSKLQEEDIKIEGKKINITLPAIEIINFSYPSSGFNIIKGFNEEKVLFSWRAISLKQKDELFRQSEIQIRESIADLGITKTAKINTRKMLTGMLKSYGYEEIYIRFKDDIENQAYEVNNLRDSIKKSEK